MGTVGGGELVAIFGSFLCSYRIWGTHGEYQLLSEKSNLIYDKIHGRVVIISLGLTEYDLGGGSVPRTITVLETERLQRPGR